MSLGIFGNGSKLARPFAGGPFGGLGDSTIPGTCWDVTGFKDCHAEQWRKAQTDCKTDAAKYFNGSEAECIDAYADQGAYNVCVPKFCPKSTSVAKPADVGLSWRNTTPNPKVTTLQKQINTILVSKGYDAISTDGKLGAGTCGAASFLDMNFGTQFFVDYGLAKICQSANVPTKNGKPATNIVVAPQVTHLTEGGKVVETVIEDTNLPWQAKHPDALALQKELNVHLASNDMIPIALTGMLDAATCGAMKWLKEKTGVDYLAARGTNCKAFTMPQKKAVLIATGPTTPLTPVGPTGPILTAPTSSSSKISTATMLTGGLLVAAAGGFYYYAKKKGWVA